MVCGLPCGPRSRNRNKRFHESPRLRVLLTNGRFPVSLDVARQLYWAGHHVYVVDPMEFHVCKFSISVWKSRQTPAPHVDPKGYIEAVGKAIQDWRIDLIIPLHEEIFFLAGCRDEQILSKLLAPRYDVLLRLHNKWEFCEMMTRFGLGVPEHHLVRGKADLNNLERSKEWAVKPVYGRAASKVYHLKPDDSIPQDIDVDEGNHYIAQEWIKGNRYCSYSVIRKGRLQAHGVYPVLETIDGSSSVFFKHMDHPRIKSYVETVARELPDVEAQLAFDFVEVDGKLVAIECNPRATSGIHLWSDAPYLARALTDTLKFTQETDYTSPPPTITGRQPRRQVLPGMMMWEHKKATPKVYAKHMQRLMGTRDIVFKWRDLLPSLMQPFLLTTYYKICREKNLELPDMFQWDVTWEPQGKDLTEVRRIIEEANARDGIEKMIGSTASQSKETLAVDDGLYSAFRKDSRQEMHGK